MTPRTPYSGLPDRQFWTSDPGVLNPPEFDPVTEVPFTLSMTDKIVTAGSCFAQHLAKGLANAGFNHFITEPAHPLFSRPVVERYSYGQFSARYGNIYSARQFLQLVQRAYGQFTPAVGFWPEGEQARAIDPFRPRIQPNGFASAGELLADRQQHFAAVRRALEEADVLVFTLGLTEAWEDTRDGAIYPLAPGVAGGIYDPETVRFRNFTLQQTRDDLVAALELIRSRNPGLRLILTVSPVPLYATCENQHVAVATSYSKAVLRCAAEEVSQRFTQCAYFPSYEIITSAHMRGCYFGPDARQVLPEGVAHVMKVFFRHFAPNRTTQVDKRSPAAAADGADQEKGQEHRAEMQRIVDVLCDEEAINNAL